MQRRLARERKEYIQKKSHEKRLGDIHERKQMLKRYLESDDTNQQLPDDLKKNAEKLREQLNFDDAEHDMLRTHADDEYALAGFEDPRILLTTSHDPSQKLLIFAKEMKLIYPNCMRMNRGSVPTQDLVGIARCVARAIRRLVSS